MTKKLLTILFLSGLVFSESVTAQCVSITCPTDIVVASDSGYCSAVVTYATPTGFNACTSALDSTTFNYSGTIDSFVVPAGVTTITARVWGAQGGSVMGGLGAYIQGDITVTPGVSLKILVGQQGLTDYGYGGGGGSFVATSTDVPLIIAGGGGGAEHNDAYPGYDALTTNDGMNVELGLGGVAGSGGEVGNPNTSGCGWSGSGGGGFYGNGGVDGDGGGVAFVNGGAGGIDPVANCVVGGVGGFGGGGAGGNAGGGGGGYSGGAGGANIGLVPNRGGGGGGSYNIGSNPINTAGVQSGNGKIVLVYSTSGPAYVSMSQGLGSGATFPVGVTTEAYFVTDSLGSTDMCSFTVTVLDTLAPAFVLGAASDTTVCVYDADVSLIGTPPGGTWSGLGVSGMDFTPSVAGIGTHTVTYTITSPNNCDYTADVDIYVDACAGVNELNASNWKVFPNPANDVVNVQFEGTYSNVEVAITEANGQLVRTEQFGGQTSINLEVSNLGKGIYFLTIDADGINKVIKFVRN